MQPRGREKNSTFPDSATNRIAASLHGASERFGYYGGLVALTTALRWGTTALGLIGSAAQSTRVHDLAAGFLLIVWAIWRTIKPVDYSKPGWKGLLPITFEAMVAVVVIVITGCWDSPYLFCVLAPIVAAGFACGFWHSLRIGLTCIAAIGVAARVLGMENAFGPLRGWTIELLLLAGLASFSRNILLHSEESSALQNTQTQQLHEANALLMGLNSVANDLSATFDVQETVHSALMRLEELTSAEFAAILLWDANSQSWRTEASLGGAFRDVYETSELPSSIAIENEPRGAVLAEFKIDQSRLLAESRSGIYATLHAAQRCIGIIVLESPLTSRFDSTHVKCVNELATTVALTIDNARWFERLRARGAAQERIRIARDLHDRVSQGIAYVAFEIERIAQLHRDERVRHDLMALHADAKTIVSELRETLHDLRADVTESQRIPDVIADFCTRVQRRSGITTMVDCDRTDELPIAIERESWRIAQEAIINAERHAQASRLMISWKLHNDAIVLSVVDDGVGMNASSTSTPTFGADNDNRRYGIVGMRERAESIGGVLRVTPAAPHGTIVTLRLAPPPARSSSEGTRPRTFGYRDDATSHRSENTPARSANHA